MLAFLRKNFRSACTRLQAFECIFRRSLQHQAAGFRGDLPTFAALNKPLTDRAELELALEECRRLGLPLHCDLQKNWDTLTAVTLALRSCPERTEAVLDAGATMYSAFLKVLYLYGFRDLTAVNLEFKTPRRLGPIRYLPGDITRLGFSESQFAFVFCQSVIEHGVSVESYFREMARIVRPGGMLLTSTDYWEPKISTSGAKAYGTDVRIFCAAEMREMLELALQYGWKPISNPMYECDESVVRWQRLRLDFTFYNLALQKTRE